MTTKILIELEPQDLSNITAELWMVKRNPEDTVVAGSIKRVTDCMRMLCQEAFDKGFEHGQTNNL
jgi:hypothetical protein